MPAVLKQTTKQAKAAFKARGRPSLTEKEQRQLERSIELEQRADRIKEAERRRTEAAKKRLEKESAEKGKSGQNHQLGSQRRCDRFGYKSSQFHLGAFFGKRPAAMSRGEVELSAVTEVDGDVFGDDDLDDDSLLEALHAPVTPQQPKTDHVLKPNMSLMPPPPLPLKHEERQVKLQHVSQDMASFFDELESSTQIARELEDGPQSKTALKDIVGSRSGSFSSGSLDLTVEDLEALDRPQPAAPSHSIPAVATRLEMPPPALPIKLQHAPVVRPAPSAMPKRLQNATRQSQPRPIRGPFLPASSLYCSSDLGFTSSQLENFIDDDIQLTQMAT